MHPAFSMAEKCFGAGGSAKVNNRKNNQAARWRFILFCSVWKKKRINDRRHHRPFSWKRCRGQGFTLLYVTKQISADGFAKNAVYIKCALIHEYQIFLKISIKIWLGRRKSFC